MTKIEFGLYLTRRNLPVNETYEYYRHIIQNLSPGFTSLWVEDHLQWDDIPTLECLTTLSFLAAEFPHYQLGSLVLCQSFRNPGLVAKMAANIQLLSKGRLILGIGAGWKEDEYSAYGYPFEPINVRLEQLEEYILIMRSMWVSQKVTITGKYHNVKDVYCAPPPPTPIPLLIGGGGERKTLRLVARYADWWNFNGSTADEYNRKLAILREHCEEVGRDFQEIKLTYSTWVHPYEKQKRGIQEYQKHIIDGTPAEVTHELKRFCEIGVTHFMLKFPDLESLDCFNGTVLPSFA